jgi:hypothetical protein
MRIDENIVYLEVNSWEGYSPGARHYFGHLIGYIDDKYTSIELSRKITNKEAIKINKLDKEYGKNVDWFKWKEGMHSNSFEKEDDLKNFAIKEYKKYFIKARILLYGNSAYVEPHYILDSDNKEFADILNKMEKEYFSFGEEAYNLKIGKSINDNWHIFLANFLDDNININVV